MEDTSETVIQYSKHYLVSGWGLKQQEKVKDIYIDCPPDWFLFNRYLVSMGKDSPLDPDVGSHHIKCLLNPETTIIDESTHVFTGEIKNELVITLSQKHTKIKSWSFSIPNTSVSSELIQLSFFLSLTDSIMLELL